MIKKLQPENYGKNPRKIAQIQVIVSEVAGSSSKFYIPANEMKKHTYPRNVVPMFIVK